MCAPKGFVECKHPIEKISWDEGPMDDGNGIDEGVVWRGLCPCGVEVQQVYMKSGIYEEVP